MELPKLKLARSCALCLSNDPVYVLTFAMQQSSEEFPNGLFAAALSGTNEVKIYSKDTFCSQCSLIGHTGRVTAIKFDVLNSHIIWSTSLDGTLRYWDIKDKLGTCDHIISKKEVGYSALDISCDGNILAAGMESIEKDGDENENKRSDVTVEFWDISNVCSKSPVCLRKFESIHSDDITHIAFHPKNPKMLVTGSTDGLVAVLDITTYEEDVALIHTLNTESSVSTIGYFGPSLEFVYILTHIETFTIWKYMEGELLTSIIDIKQRALECKNIDYVIDCIYHEKSERLFLVGGMQDGKIEVLHINLDVIEPYFSLHGGHSSIVRCVMYQSDSLLTGAEDGMVCAWMSLEDGQASGSASLKDKKKARKQKHKEKKPYKAK